jgi:hypothetical protein
MYMLIAIAVALVLIVCALFVAARRRGRPKDFGSVSAAWTTQHNVGYRGGDRP